MTAGRVPVAVVGGAATFDVAAHAVGYGDASGMPALPGWTSLLAGSIALLASMVPAGPGMGEAAAWMTAAGVLALSSLPVLPVLPHDLLVIVSDLIARGTGGEESFAVDPPWLASVRHLVVLAAAATSWRAGVLARRRARGLCPGCSRIEQWVSGVVHPSFLLWGGGLATETWQYWNGSRPACAGHASTR